jgi:hypothetical protein
MFTEMEVVEYTDEVHEDSGRSPEWPSCARLVELWGELPGVVERVVPARLDDGWESVEQWEQLRRRLYPQPSRRRTTITELYQSYEESTHTFLGCD